MSEKITALLEAIVSKKPADAREVFDSIMVEKLRSVVESHRDVVAENLFADHKADEELDEDYDYDDEEVLEEGRGGSVDKDGAHELKLFADNDSGLYHGHRAAVEANLKKHHAKGRYDHELAKKAWLHHATFAADRYAQTFGGLGERGHHIFNKKTREHAAKMMADEFRDDHLTD